MNEELGLKGSLGFNSGKPLGSMDVNAPAPVQKSDFSVRWEKERVRKVKKGGERPCVECKFCVQTAVRIECHKNAFDSRDRVTGEPIIEGWLLCGMQRSAELDEFQSYCGIEGRFFEPKEPK